MLNFRQNWNNGKMLTTAAMPKTSSHFTLKMPFTPRRMLPGWKQLAGDKLIANFQNGITGGGHIDEIEILRMEISCDMASLFCKYQATNSGVTVSGRNLLVLKKVNGQWVIAIHMTVV